MDTSAREVIEVFVDGRSVRVAPGVSVAAAVLNAGKACRESVTGERRAALCGMGICFECRVEIDGVCVSGVSVRRQRHGPAARPRH